MYIAYKLLYISVKVLEDDTKLVQSSFCIEKHLVYKKGECDFYYICKCIKSKIRIFLIIWVLFKKLNELLRLN